MLFFPFFFCAPPGPGRAGAFPGPSKSSRGRPVLSGPPSPPTGAAGMDLVNFHFDVDADGIAVVTWDMPDRSMNVHHLDVMDRARGHRREDRRATLPSRAASSPRARRASRGGADLTMLESLGSHASRKINEEALREARMQSFFERHAAVVACSIGGSRPRQAVRRGDRWRWPRRRLRAGAGLPLSRRAADDAKTRRRPAGE